MPDPDSIFERARALPAAEPVSAVEDRARVLHRAAVERGHLVSGDSFVSEVCAAELLGLQVNTLRGWRYGARPLPYRRLGGARGRVWYSLRAIARYLLDCEADADASE